MRNRFQPISPTPMDLEMQPPRSRILASLSFMAVSSSNFRTVLTVALALCAFTVLGRAQSATTPPMGWNSWNHFGRDVSDADVRAAADALVSSGMKDAGYVYVNIDDGWQGTRDAEGNIRSNSKFPDMKALAAYVHARGLKLGIYSSPGPRTCANFEG